MTGNDQRTEGGDDNEEPTTLPASTNVRLEGFASEEDARRLGNAILTVMQMASRSMDLSEIDGVTVSTEYHQALLELDRGLEGLRPLTASTEEKGAIGVAMAPAVLREGQVKTHLVFNANIIFPLTDVESEFFQQAVHTVVHECAHAAVHTAFDNAFPGVILQDRFDNYYDSFRGEVIDVCWKEYGATRISAVWGSDPTEGYAETLTTALSETDDAADASIRLYRTHGDLDRVLAEVLPLYARLIKWASYLIGTMHGLGNKIEDLPELEDTLKEHWFAEHFDKLEVAYQAIWGQFGEWPDRLPFDVIGDIALEVLDHGGIILTETRADIPFRPHNTPHYGLLNLLGGV